MKEKKTGVAQGAPRLTFLLSKGKVLVGGGLSRSKLRRGGGGARGGGPTTVKEERGRGGGGGATGAAPSPLSPVALGLPLPRGWSLALSLLSL